MKGRRTKRTPEAIEQEALRALIEKEGVKFPNVLGIDPDLHSTGLAVEGARTIWLGCAKVSKTLGAFAAGAAMANEVAKTLLDAPHFDLIVVEGQDLYRGNDSATKNPLSIVHLAFAAGAALYAAQSSDTVVALIPVPRRWKSNVPKPVQQARTYHRLGWSCEQKKGYSVPLLGVNYEGSVLLQSDWSHVGDALGLARWGREQFDKARG